MNRYASPIDPREAALGGGVFLTFFGAFWALTTLAQNPSSLTTPLSALAVGVTVALFAACVLLRRSKRHTPATADPGAKALKEATFWRFGAVVAIEVVAIGLANTLLLAADHAEFIAPAVGLIVGLHFFPLAKLFREPIYHLTGGFMTMLSGVATVALLARVTLGAPYDWSVLVGTSSALALWITAGYVLAAQFRAAIKPGKRATGRE